MERVSMHTATQRLAVANSVLLINCNKKESDDVNKHIDESLQKRAAKG